MIEIDKKKIESLLPHREPMLLIDKLINIVPLKSATAIMKPCAAPRPARSNLSIWVEGDCITKGRNS